MKADEEIMSILVLSRDLKFTMHADGKRFDLEDVVIARSKIPVRRPTTRGGVYFSDTEAYKIRAMTRDPSVISLLPKLMLGPSSEFGRVEVKTSLALEGGVRQVVLESHVSNTVSTKAGVELNMIVDKCIP